MEHLDTYSIINEKCSFIVEAQTVNKNKVRTASVVWMVMNQASNVFISAQSFLSTKREVESTARDSGVFILTRYKSQVHIHI